MKSSCISPGTLPPCTCALRSCVRDAATSHSAYELGRRASRLAAPGMLCNVAATMSVWPPPKPQRNNPPWAAASWAHTAASDSSAAIAGASPKTSSTLPATPPGRDLPQPRRMHRRASASSEHDTAARARPAALGGRSRRAQPPDVRRLRPSPPTLIPATTQPPIPT